MEINNLRRQEKLSKDSLNNSEKSNELKTEENNQLKDKISKLKEAKMDRDLSTITEMLQDDETKIFPLFNNSYEPDNVKKLIDEYTTPIKKEKNIGDKKLKKLNPEYMMEIVKPEGDETTKKFYKDEIEKASSIIKFLEKKIKKDPAMLIEKKYIVNQLKELYKLREIYFTNKFNNRPENNKNINIKSIDDDVNKYLDKLRDQEGRSVFTYQNEFVKLLTLLTQLK